MEIKIKIKTPPGLASGVVSGKNFLLLRTLFGMKKAKKDTVKTNKNGKDDTIIWIVEGDIKTCLNIQQRITMYEVLVSGIFTHKLMKKAINRGKLSDEDKKNLENMLKNMTKIEIIKKDDPIQIDDSDF